jgi:hypothetical protein
VRQIHEWDLGAEARAAFEAAAGVVRETTGRIGAAGVGPSGGLG